MKVLFLLKCPPLDVFAILSKMFVRTPYFSILYEYKLEASGSLGVKAWEVDSLDLVCPQIFEDIVYVSLISCF